MANFGYYGNANYGQQFQPQMQTNGFVPVRSEAEARNYPVAYGNSVTFKNETAPYVYTKTMGFSQLDRPIFEKYKLIKEDVEENISEQSSTMDFKKEISNIWKEINLIKEKQDEQYNISIHAKPDEIPFDAV